MQIAFFFVVAVIFLHYFISMIIKSIAETSYSGMYKISPEEGSAFFIRPEYLITVPFESIDVGEEFDDLKTDEILDAGLTCVVELKAVEYLARAEQSRFGLTRKLITKKYEKKYIDLALTYLENRNYLSDERFARAWLNTRRINHFEGKSRLLAELQARGIEKETAVKAIEEFFIENDEMEICAKAYEKFKKRGKKEDKLIAAMLQAGFTYKQIKSLEN